MFEIPTEGYVVLTGPGCPKCDTLKRQLTESGITYTEINVRENKDAHLFLVEQGFRSIPQLYINGVHSQQLNG